MSTLHLSVGSSPSMPVALRTGVALSVTVALFYALCTLVWLAVPAAFMGFMNSLFHGMDFSPLLRPAAFSWVGFVGSLVVLSIWALLAGSFFGWLRRRLEA